MCRLCHMHMSLRNQVYFLIFNGKGFC
uniref:Uncharacterized protein n=1 Tax=Anguilla anguilla TaxID=7936 RepID=A0A0E9VQ84_ANGAN